MTEPAPKLVSAVPDASPKLCTLVDKAMAFDKVDRWADARAMQAAAREALDEIRGREAATTAVTDLATLAVESAKTLQAEPSPKGLWLHDKAAPLAAKEPSAKPKRTKRVALVALVALTALGVGGWFGFRWMRARANDANDVNAALLADAGAPLVATNAAPDASDDATDDGELDIDDENPYADWEGGLASWPAADAGALASKPSPTIKPTTKGVKGTVKKKKR
jgi:hypothetical protein